MTLQPPDRRGQTGEGEMAMTNMFLSDLETDVLRCCAGEVVRLPYDASQQQATARLRQLGLIEFVYDDDQPTHYATDAGKAYVRSFAQGARP